MQARQWATRMPWSMVALAALLAVAGLAAIQRVEQLSGDRGSLARQSVWIVLSLGVMLSATAVTYRKLCRASYVLFAFALLLLVVVYFFPPVNGARRWIRLAGFSVQPSELAKVAFVLAVGRWLMHRDSLRRLPALFVPLLLCLVPMILIVREPDLGTTLVFPPVLAAMLFAAGARTRDLAKVALVALLLVPVVWSQMNREQRSRITALFEPTAPTQHPSDDAYHLYQSKQTLALGGVWGSYLTGEEVDDPYVYRLPAAKTDFVFSVLGERFGMWGTGGVLLLYVLLVARGLQVALSTREPYGRVVVVGLMSLLAVQVVINTAMTIGLAPITGLALPLVSYGGSSLISNALALGLVLNIAQRPGYEVTNEPFTYARPARRRRLRQSA